MVTRLQVTWIPPRLFSRGHWNVLAVTTEETDSDSVRLISAHAIGTGFTTREEAEEFLEQERPNYET